MSRPLSSKTALARFDHRLASAYSHATGTSHRRPEGWSAVTLCDPGLRLGQPAHRPPLRLALRDLVLSEGETGQFVKQRGPP
jgi:hypothetical protein